MSDPIQMPTRDVMMQQLTTVTNQSHAIERFYPLICDALAGTEKVPEGVVLAIQLAICDYTQGMPPIMRVILELQMPAYITAACPPDAPEFLSEALVIWQSVQQEME